jgi:hypothetical protein
VIANAALLSADAVLIDMSPIDANDAGITADKSLSPGERIEETNCVGAARSAWGSSV